MISKLRRQDDDTVIADGPRFDLPKVTGAALGILRALFGRAAMRFPDDQPSTLMFSDEKDYQAFNESHCRQIARRFREQKKARYDVSHFSCSVQFGPLLTELFLLGFDCLQGPIKNCTTERDYNWQRLDPTPVVMVMMRNGMIDDFPEKHENFVTTVLDSFKSKGVTWEMHGTLADGLLAYIVRFPHEAFGKGTGPLRICRHLHRMEIGKEGA